MIDKIGFAHASLIFSVMFAVQLFSDYPSGSLSDLIGQRLVLTLALLFYALTFFFLSIATSFIDFILVGVFNGLANAQNSGTLETWLDNNYKLHVGDGDPDRKIYGYFRSRVLPIQRFFSGLAFVFGGILATTYSRQFVFEIQAILTILGIFYIYLQIDNIKGTSSTIMNKNSYFDQLKSGLQFMINDKAVFFLIVGSALFISAVSIWGNLLLMPVYFGYTGTDSGASSLRTFIFAIGIPISILTARVTKNFSNNRYPVFIALFVLLFYPSFMILISFFPLENSFNPVGIIFTIFILTVLVPLIADVVNVLRQRIFIDLVPSESRNAIYSLLPSLSSLFGIFILPISGYVIEYYGVPMGLLSAFLIGSVSIILVYIGTSIYSQSRVIKLSKQTEPIATVG